MNLEYKNKAELEVCVCDENHTIHSNEVTAKKIVIRVEKMEDKQCVFEGDHIEYTIKICNDSHMDIENAVFCDDIPYGLEYVKDSFKVNGKPETPMKQQHDNKISFKIHKLKAKCEVTICFRVCVL